MKAAMTALGGHGSPAERRSDDGVASIHTVRRLTNPRLWFSGRRPRCIDRLCCAAAATLTGKISERTPSTLLLG